MLKWLLGKKDGPDAAAPGAIDLARYVELLLFRMCQENFLSLTLRQSERLPVLPVCDPEKSDIDFRKVRNRLKVLSNLNPFDYNEPVSGTIQIRIMLDAGGQADLTVSTQFFDKLKDPYVRVNITKRLMRGAAAFS